MLLQATQQLKRPLGRIAREAQSFQAAADRVPLSRQLGVRRHGFWGEKALWYDFETYGYDAFVSDFDRATRLSGINDPLQRGILNDKLFTFFYLRAIGAPTPTVFGHADRGRLVLYDQSAPATDFESLLAAQGRLVIKPRGASGGTRVAVVERDGDRTLVNGEPCADPSQHLSNRVLISEAVRPHPYSLEIYPHAINTLRVLVLRDGDTGEPFVVACTHRFGTSASRPVDNVARGGIVASVDIKTGVLERLVVMTAGDLALQWIDTHPDTGVRVEGTAVPFWPEIEAKLCAITDTLDGINGVGWDVAVTEDGFAVIEGNNRPDLSMQIYGPFLVDERARRAFEAHGATRRGR